MSHELMVHTVSFVQKCVDVGNSLDQKDRHLKEVTLYGLIFLPWPYLLAPMRHVPIQTRHKAPHLLQDNPRRWNIHLKRNMQCIWTGVKQFNAEKRLRADHTDTKQLKCCEKFCSPVPLSP